MKKTLLILLASVCFKMYGQLEYTFSNSTGTYTDLASPIVVNPGPWGTQLKTKMPLQFTFFTKQFDSLFISPIGISFTAWQTDFISMGVENYDSAGEISYLITGTASDRIVKIQYKDLRVNTSDTDNVYAVNYQIWLYEKTGNIEFHYGKSTITDINFTEFYFGFRDSDGSPYLAISGSAASPTLVKVADVGTFKGITQQPANGTIYTFAPYTPSSSIRTIVKPYAFIGSNQSFFYSSSQNSTLVVSDISGRVVSKMNPEANAQFVYDYSFLSSGMYLLTINSNNQLFTEKIIVR